MTFSYQNLGKVTNKCTGNLFVTSHEHLVYDLNALHLTDFFLSAHSQAAIENIRSDAPEDATAYS